MLFRSREQAIGLRQSGRLDESIALLRTALHADAMDALAWCELAHALRWVGHLPDAKAAADRKWFAGASGCLRNAEELLDAAFYKLAD